MSAFPFQDPDLPLDSRIQDLIGRLTLEEKVSQMVYDSHAIKRLGIPEYNWWNECIHGVARAGVATVFPQAIGMAATFDPDLVRRMAGAISGEARAKHHELATRGSRRQYQGLTFWSPNVNIFRDPRWGRGQETYGEDPFLAGRMGVAFVKGLQGDDPRYLKIAATAKHFAAHSGPEALRHSFDARVSVKDLRETYLPAFRDCVAEGGVESVMGAYNRVNGEPCCASPTLLQEILRDEWGFEGHVTSDCGAIFDIHAHHKVTGAPEQSAALAVKNGCDLECGMVFSALPEAVRQGLVSEGEIDRALFRLLRTRFRLGMFDPPGRVPFAGIPYDTVDCPEHRRLALDAARASIVLLKNEGDFLPLSRNLGCIAVIGPNADDREVLLGNYSGVPSRSVTVLEGIRSAVSGATRVLYARGSEIAKDDTSEWADKPDDGFGEACAAADRADAVILVLGLNNTLEGEQTAVVSTELQGDRLTIELPRIQAALVRAVAAKGKPTALILMSGSALAVAQEHALCRAVLMAWYPGEEGGTAVADVLFGNHNPSGRLPVSFPFSVDQLPPFDDYSMTGRTYRFMDGAPLYPFGYGLSFTRFSYAGLSLSSVRPRAGSSLGVTVEVTNTGTRDGHETVQLYLTDLEASTRVPARQLVAFTRVALKAGEKRTLSFAIPSRLMALIDDEGRRVLEPGGFLLSVGGRQPDPRSEELSGTAVLSARFEVTGERIELPY